MSTATQTLPLRDGSVATLLRFPAGQAPRGAVLYVHGFADYFFHDHVAAHFNDQGYDFYALDLRRYGRSLRAGDLPCYVRDLAEHFEELDAAARQAREDGNAQLVVLGHSMGGLLVPLWAHARRADPDLSRQLTAVVLNNPWFDISLPLKRLMLTVNAVLAKVQPTRAIPGSLSVYGESLHHEHRGEWEFDLALKPLTGFPARTGLLAAVRRGQRQLHRGLEVRVPILLLRAGRSRLGLAAWEPDAQVSDIVLDVRHMVQFAPKLGRDVRVEVVDDGIHDLYLSAKPVRNQALKLTTSWLDGLPSREERGTT